MLLASKVGPVRSYEQLRRSDQRQIRADVAFYKEVYGISDLDPDSIPYPGEVAGMSGLTLFIGSIGANEAWRKCVSAFECTVQNALVEIPDNDLKKIDWESQFPTQARRPQGMYAVRHSGCNFADEWMAEHSAQTYRGKSMRFVERLTWEHRHRWHTGGIPLDTLHFCTICSDVISAIPEGTDPKAAAKIQRYVLACDHSDAQDAFQVMPVRIELDSLWARLRQTYEVGA